jgi:hypothetical protein
LHEKLWEIAARHCKCLVSTFCFARGVEVLDVYMVMWM